MVVFSFGDMTPPSGSFKLNGDALSPVVKKPKFLGVSIVLLILSELVEISSVSSSSSFSSSKASIFSAISNIIDNPPLSPAPPLEPFIPFLLFSSKITLLLPGFDKVTSPT